VTRDAGWLNALSKQEAIRELKSCCGATRWAEQMVNRRPFATGDELAAAADEIWWSLSSDDWLEAFHAHPRIGEKKAASVASAQSLQWSDKEQAGVRNASEETSELLTRLNREYEARFGHIFIVCATGKSSEEMLAILRQRMGNEPATELRIAAGEQAKITRLRLKKLIE
jgi:OHCU decarboxylase